MLSVLLVSGAWDRFFSYHVWTYFPFGRMANSVRKTMEDPRMAVEQFLGVPIQRIAQDAQKVRAPREIAEALLYQFVLNIVVGKGSIYRQPIAKTPRP